MTVSAAIVVTGEAIKAAQVSLKTQHSASQTDPSVFAGLTLTWQALGIHKLGSDPANMPAVDRALPTGTLFAREMCLRLWWDIVVKVSMDYFYFCFIAGSSS